MKDTSTVSTDSFEFGDHLLESADPIQGQTRCMVESRKSKNVAALPEFVKLDTFDHGTLSQSSPGSHFP
jgi:hypothetical protein